MDNRNKYYQDEALSCMEFLQQKLDKINEWPDKSLFFQNPLIFDRWLELVRAIDNIEPFYVQKREQTTENYVLYLLSLRELKIKYKKLAEGYYYQLKDLMEFYGGWLIGECLFKEVMEALTTDQYGQDMKNLEGLNVEDFYQYLVSLNEKSDRARSAIYTLLHYVFNVLLAVMERGGKYIKERFPCLDTFAKAINDDLRLYTKDFGEDMLKEMKEDLNMNYKDNPTDPDTPALWGMRLKAYNQGLEMAKERTLTECKDPKQKSWDKHQPRYYMDINHKMIGFIIDLCRTNELINLENIENVQPFLNVLTEKNIELFYNLIVMRNLIQCEMSPELKKKHEEWLNRNKEKHKETGGTRMSEARQSKLDEIIGILQKGDWKSPATSEKITQLMNVLFGRDVSLLDEEDTPMCEAMWFFVENGGGNRMEVVPANFAGFFSEENLLNGSPKSICDDLFGKNNNQSSNFNKGHSSRRSKRFKAIIPFMTKYTNKIVRKA